MKSKGFTLTELLAVIVILGIILSITTISVLSIKEKQDQKNLENIVSLILTGAKEYNAETRISEISVKDLLDYEAVDFDKEKYSYLTSEDIVVKKIQCNDNKLKNNYQLEYVFNDDEGNFKYNDCGCELQDETASKTICKTR